MKVLVVRDAFGDHAVGEMIRDAAQIAEIEGAGQAHFCTAAEVDEGFFAEDPAPKKAPAPAAPQPAVPAPDAAAQA